MSVASPKMIREYRLLVLAFLLNMFLLLNEMDGSHLLVFPSARMINAEKPGFIQTLFIANKDWRNGR